MKLVFKTDDINEANRFSELLGEKGIPSVVEENGLRNRGSHIPVGNVVWIYVNSQYSDALKLIENPNHEVENPIDAEDFSRFYQNNESAALNIMYSSAIKYGLVFIAVVIISLMVLIKL